MGTAAPIDALLSSTTVIAPLPSTNQADELGQRTSRDLARRIVEQHRAGLEARRSRDLQSEKYLLHIDGSGDLQYADIFEDTRVEIPRDVSEFRQTENLLRPIVDNAVAHHTSMPLRYGVEALPDRAAQEQALIDALLANYLAQQQDWNGLFTDALYLAMPAGFCPVHAYWREDGMDQYEPTPGPQGMSLVPRPGMIDCWVGNPFDTVFDPAATRGSIRWCSYGRLLPADVVRRAFAYVPGIEGIEGSKHIPSRSLFQLIARDWRLTGLGIHGSPITEYRRSRESAEEMLFLLCREILPGVEAEWPEGRLQIVAVPGNAEFRKGSGGGSQHALMLHDAPLPGGDFSWALFYSHFRSDDVHGKPWVEDIDYLQVSLNLTVSREWEQIQKMANAPMVGPGGAMGEDMLQIGDGYDYLEIEPSLAGWRPRVIEWPESVLVALTNKAERLRRAMYTIGGYQAASRGESLGSRTPYRTVVALQSADNSIHAPVNQRFRRSATDFAKKCHTQFRTYGDVPWLMNVAGDEYAHLVEPYVDKTMLSARPPEYKLVSAFGTPEVRAQEVLELARMRGADGKPFLETDEAQRLYPNQAIFYRARPDVVRKRRGKTVAQAALDLAGKFRGETGFAGTDLADPSVKQASLWVFQNLKMRFPILRDDDLTAHLAAYSEITQDETADVIARGALSIRQDQYYEWQARMAQSVIPMLNAPKQLPAGRPVLDRRGVAAEVASGGARPSMEVGGPTPTVVTRG